MNVDDHLEAVLRDARRDNTRLINRIRLAGVGFFALTAVVITKVVGNELWMPLSVGLSIYTVLALLIWAGGRWNPSILWLSRFGIPVIDVPMVTAIQLFSQSVAVNLGNTSEFSISAFICLLMLSALTLNTHQIYLALAMSILGEQLLQANAGIGIGGRILSSAMLGIAAWICIFARTNRITLAKKFSGTEAKRRRLQRYFSPGIGEMLEGHGHADLQRGKECELTVLFIDIRGFTAMSEKMEGCEVVILLNSFHGKMVEALFRHAGTLDKYMGDGLLAYFNAPIGQPDHAERALRCALEMQSVLRKMEVEGSPVMGIGVGIHTGKAIVGDIGAPNRREFTVIGDAVNVASRVEQLTKDLRVEILLSESTAALVPDELSLRALGEFEIKGRSEGLRLFTPEMGGDAA